MLFKKKQKPSVIELFRDKEVAYRVTIDPKFVQFESASNDWLVRYSSGTQAAGMVNYLVSVHALDALTQVVRAQYLTGFMFMDAKLVQEFYLILERSQKRLQNARKREDDAQVLAELKAMHEKTVESVEELEKIRKK